MELLFVALGGALIGAVVRYLLPGRGAHGAALLPGVGLIAGSIVWAALTWVGWRFDGGWIWVVSLLASVAASLALGLALPRRRHRSDERMLARLARS